MNNTQFKIGDRVKLISVEPCWLHNHWLNCTVVIVGCEWEGKYYRISLTNSILESICVLSHRLEPLGQLLLFELT